MGGLLEAFYEPIELQGMEENQLIKLLAETVNNQLVSGNLKKRGFCIFFSFVNSENPQMIFVTQENHKHV